MSSAAINEFKLLYRDSAFYLGMEVIYVNVYAACENLESTTFFTFARFFESSLAPSVIFSN